MDDTISRKQAIDLIEGIETERLKGNIELIYAPAIKGLRALPPAEPKRGRWIRTGSGSLFDHYECSLCGGLPKWERMGNNRWKIVFTDYCPNCGARMEG